MPGYGQFSPAQPWGTSVFNALHSDAVGTPLFMPQPGPVSAPINTARLWPDAEIHLSAEGFVTVAAVNATSGAMVMSATAALTVTATSGPPGPPTYISDTFTGANSTAINAHTPDIGGAWGGTTFVINSNSIAIPGNFISQSSTTNATAMGSADFDLSLDILANAAAVGGDYLGVMGRGAPGAGNFYAAYYNANYGGTAQEVRLSKFVGNAETILGTYALAYVQGVTHNLKFRCQGTTISVLIDGASVISLTDTTYTTGTTVGLLSATTFNMCLAGDNFLATDVAVGGTVTGAVAMSGSSGMTVGALVTEVAAVAMSSTTTLTAAATSAGTVPARLQSWKSTVATGGVTSTSGQATSNMTAGSTMICLVGIGVGSTETITSVVDNLGNNFWKVIETPFNAFGLASLWALNTPSAQVGQKPTLTATKSGTGYTIAFLCQEVSNLVTGTTAAALCDGTPLYTQAPLSIPASPANDVPYSSTATGEYTISCYTDPPENGSQTVSMPSGMVSAGWVRDPNSIDNSPQSNCCMAYKLSISGSETPNTWVPSANEDWNQVVIAFKVGGGGGPATVTGAVALSGSSGMTVGAVVKELAAVTMSSTTTLTAAGIVTEIAAVAQAATAGLTVAGSVTEVAAVTQSATAGLTVSGVVAEVAVVAETAATSLTIAALVTEIAVVTMSATTTLSATAGGSQVITGTVTMSGTTTLVVSALVIEIASVSLASTAGLVVAGLTKEVALVSMSGATTLVVAGATTEVAVVAFTATASMTVSALVIELGVAAMTATTTLTVAGVTIQRGIAALSATAGLTVAAAVTELALVAMAGTTSLTVVGSVVPAGGLTMSGLASLTVSGLVTEIAQVVLSATAGMTVTGIAKELGLVPLAATASLTVAGLVKEVALVTMSGATTLVVSGVTTGQGAGSFAGVATSTLVVAAVVTEQAAVVLVSSTTLTVSGLVKQVTAVAMAIAGTLTVSGQVTAFVTGAVAMSAVAGLSVIAAATITFGDIGIVVVGVLNQIDMKVTTATDVGVDVSVLKGVGVGVSPSGRR